MADANTNNQPRFDIKRVYVKDLSFESPAAPKVFAAEQFSPQMNIQLNIGHTPLDSDHHEVILTVTADAKGKDDTSIFLVEVQQAGVFEIVGLPENEFPLAVEVAAPQVLLPFAREAISDIVQKGGFPQLLLAPVNFEALYAQKQVQETS